MSRAPPASPRSSPPRATGSTAERASARKVHRARLPDQDDLDLPRVLELGLDPPRDLLRERRHPHVVDVFGGDDDPDLAPGLDREHLVDPLVAGRDTLESF